MECLENLNIFKYYFSRSQDKNVDCETENLRLYKQICSFPIQEKYCGEFEEGVKLVCRHVTNQ